MSYPICLLIVALFCSTVHTLPAIDGELAKGLNRATIHPRCGSVSTFYGQTPQDWVKNDLDGWLNNWINANQAQISANPAGFAGAFGQWAQGNPDWSCRDDGSPSNCDFDPCDNAVLNDKGTEVMEAYYVSEAVNRLHSYFVGFSQAFEVSSIFAALSKDDWAVTFYKDKDVKSDIILKSVLAGLGIVFGIAAAFAGLGGAVAAAAGGTASALFNGGVGIATPLIDQHRDDTFQKSADLGGILGNIVVSAMKAFVGANNVLMGGGNFENTGDIRTYLSGGFFVNYGGVDKVTIIDSMNGFLIGQAINQLWRTQKIFIMGGGACSDNQGIGSGPQEAMVCRDNRAWYLYYWKEHEGKALTSHKWGWVEAPPGMDQLGQGEYSSVTVADVINSSLDAYAVAGYDYTTETAASRARSAIEDGWRNPGAQGPSWEGTFTIPVCDVGAAVGANYFNREYILQPYGHESRPNWCGPVCGGSEDQTKAFIEAAHMTGFESPTHLCWKH